MDIKCLNWFESKGENRALFLKARDRNNDSVFIKFEHNYYYVVRESTKNELTIVPKYSKCLGDMNIVNIDERVITNTAVKNYVPENSTLWLIAHPSKLVIKEELMAEFLNITWFFLINNIVPDGCFRLNTDYLTLIRKGCYFCNNPELCFKNPIPRFDVSKTYLYFDIECQFEKKFPSVFTNPVSHISCCYIDKFNKEYKFTIVNKELLSQEELDKAGDILQIDTVNEMDYDADIVLCSEITLLRIVKKLLELSFDYIVTFNGHNFDIKYLSTRLTILTNEYILFKTPDKAEAVRLCVYERNLASHKGAGGMANTTYHVNNNNGTLFFDLYAYIQKTEKLDSYKLDSIAKHAFYCKSVACPDKNGNYMFVGNNSTDAKGKAELFSAVLATGNYITINDHVCKVVRKEIYPSEFKVVLDMKNAFTPITNETYELSFGKDNVSLSDMYKNFTLVTAIEMANYCLHDAVLCKHLWKHYGIETKIDAAAATYILPQCLAFEYRASTLIKGPLLQLLLETKTVLVKSGKQKKLPYEGGRVFAPKKKMFTNNVMIFDYNSLYPNVCIYGNLSPETLVSVVVSSNRLEYDINLKQLKKKFPQPNYILVECEPRSEDLISEVAIFDRQQRGIIPKLLLNFLDKRAKYKKMLKEAENSSDKEIYDSMQYMYKIIANSVYGLMGFRSSVLYSYASAKSCTSIGRSMITYLDSVLNGAKLVDGFLELASNPTNPFFGGFGKKEISTSIDPSITMNFNSVYGDTDSVFLEVDSKDVETTLVVAKELEKIINSIVLFDNFRIEFEAVYKNLIMQSKKKYSTLKIAAGSKNADSAVRINKGTSETRRDVSKFHKCMIKKYKTQLSDTLSAGILTDKQVCVDTLKSLELDLMLEFEMRQSPLEMFLLSRTHHCNYKLNDNPNMALVNKYNSENVEAIEIGERYYFAYVCPETLPWQKKLTNIKTFERIVDKSFTLDGERIFYEIYFKRLATEIVNLLDNKVLSTQLFEKLFGTKPIFYS
ncbi:DNA polymerase [Pteropox virus]|uniref:DNA polymerase n=1 Tax=Pteropox virus TaxID=1873698 RepID=A0A1B1MR93_9POXV|nr:DNA polymerase [Pteropox virus]ANS71126.1 DNA polymerase [Pteropox virus]